MSAPNKLGQQVLRELGKSKKPKRALISRQRKLAAQALIERLIEKRGYSQLRIAEHLGVTQASISKSMHGLHAPSATTLTCLVALARKHNIKTSDIQLYPL